MWTPTATLVVATGIIGSLLTAVVAIIVAVKTGKANAAAHALNAQKIAAVNAKLDKHVAETAIVRFEIQDAFKAQPITDEARHPDEDSKTITGNVST